MAGATSPFCVFYKLMGKWIWRKLQKIRWIFGEYVNAETFLLWYNNLYEG